MELFILSYTFSHVCRTELFKKELIRVGMTEKLMKKRGKVKRKKTRKAEKKVSSLFSVMVANPLPSYGCSGGERRKFTREDPQKQSTRLTRGFSLSFPGYDAGADGATLRAPDTPNQGVSRVCLVFLGLPLGLPLGRSPWALPLDFL